MPAGATRVWHGMDQAVSTHAGGGDRRALFCPVPALIRRLSVPAARAFYARPGFRLALHLLLIAAFGLAIVSLVLRTNKVLGFTAIALALLATVMGGSRVKPAGDPNTSIFFGLDWFVLNVIFTGFLFIPLERLFPRHKGQALFRQEWREDLFYYLVSSLFVQVLTFISMTPALAHSSRIRPGAHSDIWVGSPMESSCNSSRSCS